MLHFREANTTTPEIKRYTGFNFLSRKYNKHLKGLMGKGMRNRKQDWVKIFVTEQEISRNNNF